MRVAPLEVTALLDTAPVDAVLVDARRDLLAAKALCRLLRTTGTGAPLLAVLTEGGLAALSAEWGLDDEPVLKQYLFLVGLDENWPNRWYDLQRIFLQAYPRKEGEGLTLESVVDRLGIPKEEPFHNALDDALYTARVCRKLPLAEGLATYPTEEELLTEALLGAENTGRDVKLFMNRMEHDDYRSVPELYQADCPECGAPLQNDEVWLKRGNTGYFTRAACPYCGHWYLRFKLSRRDGLHWSFARCIDPATPEYDARWDKQKAALLERMKRKQERNIKE